MQETIKKIFNFNKGILAADESTPTIKKRFDSIGVESTEVTRKAYREMLFTTSGLNRYIGGVILFEETCQQKIHDATFVEYLTSLDIVPGIKVDKGAKVCCGSGEQECRITEGLDGLRDRLETYKEWGLKFAKWRAVFNPHVAGGYVTANIHALASYAFTCQQVGLVPIIEPEILMDGEHGICQSAGTTEDILHELFNVLWDYQIKLEEIILKTNMVVSGYCSSETLTREEVAEETIRVLKRTVPAAVPVIAFLSGGQEDDDAISNLREMNTNKLGLFPWQLRYSFGRALQGDALRAWEGKKDNAGAVQNALSKRAGECHRACQGY